jgi:hypothetical protein
MHAKFLLVGGLALLLGGCSGKASHGPPPLDKKLLTGKWKNSSDTQFLAGHEFAEDGTLKTTFRGMRQPVPGRYTWGSERSLDLKYEPTPDVKEAYQAAAKAYKDDVRERIKSGALPDRAGPSILGTVRDELPAEEALRVSISEKPRLLILGNASGESQTFERAD